MKKPVRPVAERTETEATNLEVDLRGLGQSAILSDLPPLPYLFIRHCLGISVAEIAKRHELQVREHEAGHILHGKASEHYKSMCVNLFVTALRVTRDHKQVELYLGHQDLLRQTLESNAEEFMAPQGLAFHKLKVPEFHGPLTVSLLHQIVLHQVGITSEVHEQDFSFEKSQLSGLYQDLVTRFAQPVKHREVSGE